MIRVGKGVQAQGLTHGKCVQHRGPKATIEASNALLLVDPGQNLGQGEVIGPTLDTRRKGLDARFSTFLNC